MSSNIISVSETPSVPWPDFLALDTNVLVVRYFGANLNSARKYQIDFADKVFDAMGSGETVGVVTPHTVSELYHLYLRARYRKELKDNHARFQGPLSKRFPGHGEFDWHHLYKIRSGLVKRMCAEMDQLRLAIIASNAMFLRPEDLQSLPQDTSFEQELTQRMKKFELDASDAFILLEAELAGVTSIATLDKDMRRARTSFRVFTWN